MVAHFLAKERVAGSNPVFRSVDPARFGRCENQTVFRDWVAFLAAFASLTLLRVFTPIEPVISWLLLLVLSGALLLLLRRAQERRG